MTTLNIDTSKTPQQNLVALVNAVNGTTLTASDVSFGTPSNTDGVGANLTPGTSVQITGNGTTATGSVSFAYDRVDIKRAAAMPSFSVSLDAQLDTPTSSLTKIATALGMIDGQLKSTHAIAFPGGFATSSQLGLHADPASLLYCGTSEMAVTWTNPPVPAPFTWMVSSQPSGHQTRNAFCLVNGVLWKCRGSVVYGYNASTGAQVAAVDLQAALSLTGLNYDIGAIDANGLLWLESINGYNAANPMIIRFDTVAKAVHDSLYTGTSFIYRSTQYDPINNVVWAIKSNGVGNSPVALVQFNVTTGATQTTLATSIGTIVGGTVLDTRRGQLWVSDNGGAGNASRIRVIKVDGTVLMTSTTGNYYYYDRYALYAPLSDEIIISDYDGTAGQYRLSRWSASTMTMTLSVDITNSSLDPNIQQNVSISHPVYDALQDKLLMWVEWQDSNSVYHDELWSVDRSTLADWTTTVPQEAGGTPDDDYLTSWTDGSLYASYNGSWLLRAPAPWHSRYVWDVKGFGEGNGDQYMTAVANGKVWTTDGHTLRGLDVATGAVEVTISIDTAVGNNYTNYASVLVDKHGILWLGFSGTNGNPAANNNPSYVRVDTSTGTVKDQLFANANVFYGNVAYNPTTDKLYTVTRTWNAAYVFTLVEIDAVTGAVSNTLPTAVSVAGVSMSLAMDPVNNHLWLYEASGGEKILVIDVATGNVLQTITSFSTLLDLVYVPSQAEMVVLGYDKASTNLLQWTRYNPSSYAVILQADITDTRLDSNQNNGAQAQQPIRYLPWTDEFAIVVGYDLPDGATTVYEVWAYSRTTLAFSRVVDSYIGQLDIYDIGVDTNSNIYIQRCTPGLEISPQYLEIARLQD
jgi:hypothetical protein